MNKFDIILLGIIAMALVIAMTLDLYTDVYPDSPIARTLNRELP